MSDIENGLSIKTKRLLLRPIADNDVPFIKNWLKVGSLFKYWSSRRECEGRILDTRFYKEDDLKKSYHWGVEFEDKVIGEIWVYVEKNSDSAKIAYRVSSEYWGMGIATESVCAVVKFCFETINVFRVWADVFIENKASMHVLENVGFQQMCVIRNNKVESNYDRGYYIYEITQKLS